MDADIQGALDQINKSWRTFTHKGKRMTKDQVKIVLEHGIAKGYKSIYQIPDAFIDQVVNK